MINWLAKNKKHLPIGEYAIATVLTVLVWTAPSLLC